MNQFESEIVYLDAVEAKSWVRAAELNGILPGEPPLRRGEAARRIAKRYARSWGGEWPFEGIEQADAELAQIVQDEVVERERSEAERAARSYLLARWGSSWGEVAAELGMPSAQMAEREAAKHAEQHRRKWPPLTTSKGRDAYELRASEWLTWPEVGERLDANGDWVCRAAKVYADEMGKPWPIEPPNGAEAARKYRDTGALAWVMRAEQHMEWEAIAEELGIGHEFAHRKAQEHAYANGLMWPILLPDSPEGRVYELRLRGVGWKEIAEREGRHLSVVKARAQKYAKAHGFDWPMKVAPVRTGHSENAEAAYRMGYVERRPWKEVAAELGYSTCQAALNSAKVYAKRFGLPYHAQRRNAGKRDGTRKRRAYEMKVADLDRTWADISRELGYRSNRGAHTAAKQWAQANDLPWPL